MRKIWKDWKDWIRRIVDPIRNKLGIITFYDFPMFAPDSAGGYNARTQLTVKAGNQIFPFLVRLIESTRRISFGDPTPIRTFANSEDAISAATTLKELLDKYGSDKGIHEYHYLYGSILQNPDAITDILEIGLGTNNLDVVSNMGNAGKPGASLRAFRDFLPNATVLGADIDKRVLFQEGNIKTFFVDQTDPESLDLLFSNTHRQFDLIIDDGLHAPNANIASLVVSLKFLKKDGWFVAEDIQSAKLPIWRVVSTMLPDDCRAWIVSSKLAYLFVVKRTGAAPGS
jgi:hypothetical protein